MGLAQRITPTLLVVGWLALGPSRCASANEPPGTDADAVVEQNPVIAFDPDAPVPPPPRPFSSQLFDNDFSYMQDPHHTYIYGEELKGMPLATLTGRPIFDQTTLSAGGELRFRYIDQDNVLRAGGPAQSSFDQWRWRNYFDVHHSDYFRAYVEGIEATTNHGGLPLQGGDQNRWDLQNYFADVRLPWSGENGVWVRVGRQELMYGSQRLVSTFDWSNIRRNFEGIKLFTRQDDWDFDLWIVNPVNTATSSQRTVNQLGNTFDTPNRDYIFGGAYSTYRGIENHTIDLFFLYANLNVPVPGLPYGNRYTIGTRWLGNLAMWEEHLLQVEVEGGYQFGNDRSSFYNAASPSSTVSAGYFTMGAGHTWQNVPLQPALWWYWDWASGDNNPTDRQNNTFFQMFGNVHNYLGQIDNIGRQNISDLNVRWTFKPSQPMLVTLAHHWFQLANQNDVLYNAYGAPVGSPGHGTDVGQEFDMRATYAVNANWSMEAGYFWFWYGKYIDATAPRGDAQQVYVMSTLRY